MRTSERGKMGSLWLPLIAVVLFLAASTAFANLLDMPSVTLPIIQGGALGLGLAAAFSGMPLARLSWLGWLIVLVPVAALLRWVVMPLTNQFVLGYRTDPLFAGFDGSNLTVLVPGLLYLAAFVLVYSIYAVIAHRTPAAP